jgi:hypothetical protein
VSRQGFVSGCREGSEASFNSREGGISNDGGNGAGFISHREIERGFVGYGARAMVVGKFGMRDHFHP